MVEESDNSDSWGSMLINAILVKSGLISGEKSKIHNVNQEHQLIGSKKPKTVKDASNDLADREVVDNLNSCDSPHIDWALRTIGQDALNKIILFSNYETNEDFKPTKMLGI